MRLSFDSGTLVITEAPANAVEWLPGAVWDPRVALLRAPAHLYGDVVAAIEHRRLPLHDDVLGNGRASTGPWRPVELRPYQQSALLSWEVAGRRGILVLPTGSGKTRVAIAALAAEQKPALCLVPTRALLDQWLTELGRHHAGPIGCLGDGRSTLAALTVSTFESAYRHMPRIGARFDLLVVDEVHHFGVGARDEALEMSVASRRLGLTATPPAGAPLAKLEGLVGPIAFELGIGDLTGRWLAEFDLVTVHLRLTAEERARYASDERLFKPMHKSFLQLHPQGTWSEFVSSASKTAEGRTALLAWRRSRRLLAFTRAKADAVRALLTRHRDSRVLVFTADNHAAYAIARAELVMPITCDIPRAERERALAAFREGTLRVLVSARVLNEGVDVPDADVAIVVGSTRGQREYVQRVGRLLRPLPGKRAIVYELVTLATSEPRRSAERRRALAAAHPRTA